MKTQRVLFGYSLLVLLPFSVSAMQDDPYEPGHQLFRKAEYTAAHKKYSGLLQKKVGSEDQQDAAEVSDAQCCIAMAINTQDDSLLQEGFKKFDQRIPLEVRKGKRKPLRKEWKKGFNPDGKKVFVLSEYGFGDTFSFTQFLPVLKRLGAHITVLPQKQLSSIVGRCKGVDKIVSEELPEDEFDCDVYLMSLPRYLSSTGLSGITFKTIPNRDPWIRTNWNIPAPKMNPTKLNVCICTKASKNPVAGGTRIINRNIEESYLATNLIQVAPEHVRLFSVQWPPIKDVDGVTQVYDDRSAPFENTLRAIEESDVVVSVDTAIPNVSSAMYRRPGSKVIFLLKKEQSDMRWGNKGDRPVWFSSAAGAMLLRQQTEGDWAPVMKQLGEIVQKQIAEKFAQ